MAGNFQAAFYRRQRPCSRTDFKAPLLIFAGLFVLCTGVRALDASSVKAVAAEEVNVLRAESPLTPVDADLMMGGCHSTQSKQHQALQKTSFKKIGGCQTAQSSSL